MSKVTWIESQRIHRSEDGGKSTICGHVIVKYELHKSKRKRHCTVCFRSKAQFKASWLLKREVVSSA